MRLMEFSKAYQGKFFKEIKAAAVPEGMSWMWTLAFDYHEDRTPTHGNAATREAAMAAFAKSWRREWPRDVRGEALRTEKVCRENPSRQ
jgi:hypothetical protein